MNPIHAETLEKANDAAIYTLYLYLAHKTDPAARETLQTIVHGLEAASTVQPWNVRDRYRLHILRNAINRRTALADSAISDLTRSESGTTACVFTNPSAEVFVVFRGTGSGEWMDNGRGLSGIPEENTYITYGDSGNTESMKTVPNDYATDQQVEALNWFSYIAAKNGWDADTGITLAGHSKGGNKAQFVAVNTDLADACFSFDGQGFSPEALAAIKKQHGAKFANRIRKINSMSADNDYVNVLGQRLMPEDKIYFFQSSLGFHYLEAMLDGNGRFLPQSGQGELSRYVQGVSEKLMRIPPLMRQYITLGVMRIFQEQFGQELPANAISLEKATAGIAAALGPLLESAALYTKS